MRRDLWQIVTHPAFRIGFLDAQRGAACEHDDILARIRAETPKRVLDQIGWNATLAANATALAQYRYEEGRLAVLEEGLQCKAWRHPGYPPPSVRAHIAAHAGL
jgi:hypothetical protein